MSRSGIANVGWISSLKKSIGKKQSAAQASPDTNPSQRRKKVSRTGVVGQRGVNLIEKIILEMGSLWHPFGSLEVGTDGIIELCDKSNQSPLGLFLGVQSKATEEDWSGKQTLRFYCSAEDIAYWTSGNFPIILIYSNPNISEAYWVSVKDYFAKNQGATNTIVFDRTLDRLDLHSFEALVSTARAGTEGLYMNSRPKPEQLYLNLLPVISLQKVYIAEAISLENSDLGRFFDAVERAYDRPVARVGSSLISYEDPKLCALQRFVKAGRHVATEDLLSWALEREVTQRSAILRLLYQTLKEALGPSVVYIKDCNAFAFGADGSAKLDITYKGRQKEATRSVFKEYSKEGDPKSTYYRHLAFEARFQVFGGQWFLEINPTYVFTLDGAKLHPAHAKFLSKMKRMERHMAVANSVHFWATYIRERASDGGLIAFGELPVFELQVGIEDKVWQNKDIDFAPSDQASDEEDLQEYGS